MKWIILAATCAAVVSCVTSFTNSDGSQTMDTAHKVALCESVARDAGDGGHLKAYDDCISEAGVK